MGRLETVPGKQNWLEHLPAAMRAAWHRSLIYRSAVRQHEDRGVPISIAIPSAINWAKHICRTGDVKQWKGPQRVAPGNRAEACAAVALWNAMRAAARTDTTAAEAAAQIDLAAGYIAYKDGVESFLPAGATAAYLDLVEAA